MHLREQRGSVASLRQNKSLTANVSFRVERRINHMRVRLT